MKENIYFLKKEFSKIKNKGWVIASSKGNGNVGITFETLFGKERENFPISDYMGIELKTSIDNYSRPYLTLFSATPDGKYIYTTKLLKEKYGWKDSKLEQYKVFYARVTANKLTKINNKFLMKLKIEHQEQKIFLEIFNLNYELIEMDCYWDFSTIKQKLSQKLNYLAYIKADRKYENKKVYFHYKEIDFYKIKNFENFIDLIEKGNIKICFKIGIYHSKDKLGKTYDHGTGFEIKKEDLLKLYDKINITK